MRPCPRCLRSAGGDSGRCAPRARRGGRGSSRGGCHEVAEVMSVPVITCMPETWLAQAARVIQREDCGMLPVVDSDGRVVGIITDRDISLAIAASNRSPRAIAVHEVMTKSPVVAREDDDLSAALSAMGRRRVRRLPVFGSAGRPTGMLSL